MRDIKVYVASDEVVFGDNRNAKWKEVGELKDIPIGPGHDKDDPYGTSFKFKSTVKARYVRLDIQRNWGNHFNTLLAEVQFYGKPDVHLFIAIKDE